MNPKYEYCILSNLSGPALPGHFQQAMGLSAPGDLLRLHLLGGALIIEKYQVACTFCGGSQQVFTYHNYPVCMPCAAVLAEDFLRPAKAPHTDFSRPLKL